MNFILYGDFLYSDSKRNLIIKKEHYAVCENGISQGVFDKIPSKFSHFEVIDHSNRLIIPGLVDLHLHAPQYEFRGTGMDYELIDWLNTYTFNVESKFSDIDYADKVYDYLVSDLKKGATTRAVILSSIHKDATLKLMEKLDASGLQTFVGKVNMDRNAPSHYIEDTERSINDTIDWIERCNFKNTKPILTPRFIPSCSDALLCKLQELIQKHKLCIQSHLSENKGEVSWVDELCPWSEFYGDAYDKFDMFGSKTKTIMAHCVLSNDKEIELMQKNGTYIAHCPSSNLNLSSGIAPIAKYLSENLKVGFGSDVAGGHSLSLFNEMVAAIQASKMYKLYVDSAAHALTINDVLYMATLGGGGFFGQVGSFAEGFAFDAIIIDDSKINLSFNHNLSARLERAIYLSNECEIKSKFVAGKKLF